MPVRISQLAPFPPRGWNSFDAYGVHLDEQAALETIQVMAERLLPLGYDTFVIDEGWYSEYEKAPGSRWPMSGIRPRLCLDSSGRYVPSTKVFPNGLNRLIDRAHQLGLQFGLHLLRGIPREAVERNLPVQGTPFTARDIADTSSTCSWNDFNYGVDVSRPGGREYYRGVVRLLASWGVDFLKYDDIVGYPREIEAVAEAIETQDRPIVLSLSPGNAVDWDDLPAYSRANMVRLTRDVWDRPECLDRCFDAWAAYGAHGASGFWPDLDMMPLGHLRLCLPPENVTPGVRMPSEGTERWCRWTAAQQRTFVTMLAMAASPMFLGGDLLTLPQEAWTLIGNADIIACNRNAVVGQRVARRGSVEIWRTPRRDGAGGWIGLFNRGAAAERVELNLGQGFARDVWSGEQVALDPLRTGIPAGGVCFLACDSP